MSQATNEQAVAAPQATERTVTGTVVSTKMQKTITVAVERLVKHGRYDKYVRRTTKLMAHDEAVRRFKASQLFKHLESPIELDEAVNLIAEVFGVKEVREADSSASRQDDRPLDAQGGVPCSWQH